MSVSAFAALSPKLQEWGKGPVQWIMTKEEKRAWGAVKTDQEAIDFIDLFWARRDPSAGTPENETRDEFDSRVNYADKNFVEPRNRGAMTERGRVYVVLGPATQMGSKAAGKLITGGAMPDDAGFAGPGGSGAFDPSGGHALGARDEWIWERADALKFGMPRILAVFIQDTVTHVVKRDTQRNDVMAAMPIAIRNAVVYPEMTAVPKWAARGGLEPHVDVLVIQQVQFDQPQSSAPAPSIEPAKPVIAPGDLGATRFTLVKDVFAINTETKVDPFTRLSHVATFTRQDELGWVAQYCSEATNAPTLKVTIKITGEVNGETVNMNALPEEMTPDRIKATPGCWLVRGAIPVADMDPATYKFKVAIEDLATSKSYNLTQEFKVE